MSVKVCTKCGVEKDISCFSKNDRTKDKLRSQCKDCDRQYMEEYRKIHENELKEYQKTYDDNRAEDKKIYYQENRTHILEVHKNYKENNKDVIRGRNTKYSARKRQFDPNFKLRDNVSRSVLYYLKNNASSKNGTSCLNYLPFSILELKIHLEKQFEPWMTWDNYGKYIKKNWNDQNLSTWTWQIDHIIPQSDLPYTSMLDENFKKCWALENLRPLSAKQNCLDGVNKVRHIRK